MSAINTVVRGVLSTPLLHRAVSRQLLVIDVIGRKTGTTYRIPVAYTPSGDALLVVTGGTWRRNLVAGRPVRVLLQRRSRWVIPEVVTDEERCVALLAEVLAGNPAGQRQLRIALEPDGTPSRVDVRAALERGIVVVRLQPAATEEER